MRKEPELHGVAIVLRGRFNPAIYQPYWFLRHNLISEQAAETARIGAIHPELTKFSIDQDFSIEVDEDRFRIDTAVDPTIRIRDIVVSIFSELLPHTPIAMLGINRLVHFTVSPAKREQIGLLLAPREPWGDFGRRVTGGSGQRHGGLERITLIQREVGDRAGAGWIKATVEPSRRVGGIDSGIYMEINDHREIDDPNSPVDASLAVEWLADNFEASKRNSESIIDQIMSLAE